MDAVAVSREPEDKPSRAAPSKLRLVGRVSNRALGVTGFLLLWWAGAGLLGPTRLPNPVAVAKTFVAIPFSSPQLAAAGISEKGGIAGDLAYTAEMFLIGVSLGSFGGYLIGLAMARFPQIRDVLEPPIELIRAVPPLALLPFLGMWLGPGGPAQVVLVASYVSLIVLITTVTAVDNLKPVYGKFAATLGASRGQLFRSVVMPAIVPELVGGLRVAMGLAWGFQVVAELVGSRQGVGVALLTMIPRFMTKEIIATILWISALALITDLLFVTLVRRLTAWQPRAKTA
jgi:ABC-type nitrate/sulfonate/bicarbonate transport system permease component